MNYERRLSALAGTVDPTPDDFAAAVALLEDLDEYIMELRDKVRTLEDDLDETRHLRS